jgi:hypothetical protein
MLAKLTGAAALTRISGLAATNGIPFRIEGTTANPIFVPDVGRAVGDAVAGLVSDPESAKKAVSALGGLFGGKKR